MSSVSVRDSIASQDGPSAVGSERRNTRVKRAVRISSLVAQEVSRAVFVLTLVCCNTWPILGASVDLLLKASYQPVISKPHSQLILQDHFCFTPETFFSYGCSHMAKSVSIL